MNSSGAQPTVGLRRWPADNLPAPTDHPEACAGPGRVAASAGGLLVQRQGRCLLIDAGLGVADGDLGVAVSKSGALLDTLTALGHEPQDVEALAFTHPHTDHTGWGFVRDADGKLVKTFPKARYLASGSRNLGPGAPGDSPDLPFPGPRALSPHTRPTVNRAVTWLKRARRQAPAHGGWTFVRLRGARSWYSDRGPANKYGLVRLSRVVKPTSWSYGPQRDGYRRAFPKETGR